MAESSVKTFISDKPCHKGHVGERYIKNDRCATCDRANAILQQKKNPESANRRKQEYKDRHPESCLSRARIKAGLPVPTRSSPVLCEACGDPEKRKNKQGHSQALALDHCHKTGEFRGWLCKRCNQALGQFDDNPELIRKLAQYLEKEN